MEFTKMNGAGNDFIIINNIKEQITLEEFPEMARKLCARRMSIGADGLMVVEKAKGEGDYRMIFYNSDGSVGEMCGNGARCIARYGYENGLAKEIQKIETDSGLVIGERLSQSQYKVRLNNVSFTRLDFLIKVLGESYNCSYVELGNPGLPHAVVEIKGLKDKYKLDSESLGELRKLGKAIRFYKDFPKGANVNFYEITGEDEVCELTFERGVEDFTFACGTGTGSVVSVLTLKEDVSGENVKVSVPGGDLYVTAEKEAGRIKNLYLTGPAMLVAVGRVID